MVFQTVDDKRECIAYYSNGEIIYDRIPSNASGTWDWSPHFAGHNIDYAYVWCRGKKIDEICPPETKQRLEVREKKIKSFLNAIIKSKIKLSDVCIFDFIPEAHLKHYLQVKNEICQWVFDNVSKPKNYNFLSQTYETVKEISNKDLQIDWDKLYHYSLTDRKAHSLRKRFDGKRTYVNYDMFGTKTGRMGLVNGSFPILNIKSEHKGIIKPNNDWFVELDYNGAEIRTLLSLSKKQQPDEDIHEFHMKNIYRDFGTRAKAKERFFAWLYNSNSKDYLTERYYDRKTILESHYCDGFVNTPFGRSIESDDFHALNYLLQSTSSDNCMSQVNKIHRFLRDKKSNVAFVVHDSVVIDLDHNERNILPQIKEIFEETKLGKFKTDVKIGKNYGELREFSW